jgi:hypothetical protein
MWRRTTGITALETQKSDLMEKKNNYHCTAALQAKTYVKQKKVNRFLLMSIYQKIYKAKKSTQCK